MALDRVEHRSGILRVSGCKRTIRQRRIQIIAQPLPAATHIGQHLCGFLDPIPEQFGIAELLVVLVIQRKLAGEKFIQRIQQLELVVQRQLDVDALDAVAIIAHARQRDHHVLVDLERVGVFGNRGGARTVQPEFFARLGGYRDETFAAAQIGQAHHFRSGQCRRIRIVAHHIGDQHHLWTGAAFRFGGIAHRLEIALVQMFQPGQQSAGMRVHIGFDFHDRGNRIANLAEEFQAYGAGMLVGAMQDEARRGDDAVATFLLDAGQAGQEFVGDILAQPHLAECTAGNGEDFRFAMRSLAVRFETADAESRVRHLVDLAEVVTDPLDVHP